MRSLCSPQRWTVWRNTVMHRVSGIRRLTCPRAQSRRTYHAPKQGIRLNEEFCAMCSGSVREERWEFFKWYNGTTTGAHLPKRHVFYSPRPIPTPPWFVFFFPIYHCGFTVARFNSVLFALPQFASCGSYFYVVALLSRCWLLRYCFSLFSIPDGTLLS